jgi:hypothetical protein
LLDAEWIRAATRLGYRRAVSVILEHPDPAVGRYCLQHWDWTRQTIVDAITKRLVLALAEHDCNLARERGQLQ